MIALGRGGGTSAAESLCVALRTGGHSAAEAACDVGAVQAAVALLGRGAASDAREPALVCAATEALWFLVDDYDSCQLLIGAGGHDALLRLARERAPQDEGVASNTFRLLAESLYGEAKNAKLWAEMDACFLVEALDWALRTYEPAAIERGEAQALGFICDVLALWLQRAGGSAGADMAKILVCLVPRILERMAASRDDSCLIQHGCRLMWALAKRGEHWPEDMQQPALAALSQMATMNPFQAAANPEAMAYSGMAFHAVAALPPPPTCTAADLSIMD